MLGNNIHVTNVAPGPVQTNVASNALKGDGSMFYSNSDQTDSFKKLVDDGMAVKK
jgi:short-subunit dehydrogenase